MPHPPAIAINNLSFAFGADPVLKTVNLSFEPGKFYAVLGPNGSGKTTLLRNIAGAVAVRPGVIWVNDTDLTKLSSSSLARQLAVVPQNTVIDFDFSVFDIVLMGRTPYLPRFAAEGEADLALAQHAMELTDTWQLRERSINQLSGGERQRVIVARAIAQQTGIIALDEPVSHLDLQHQIALLKQLKELNRTQRITVLVVLHDLNLAATFSDRLILMHQGRVDCQGSPAEILQPEIIKRVYGVEVDLIQAPGDGRPYVIPRVYENI
jgi:iron complex transport system ATP-binding protein